MAYFPQCNNCEIFLQTKNVLNKTIKRWGGDSLDKGSTSQKIEEALI